MRVSKDVFLALASLRRLEGASQLIDADGLRTAAVAALTGSDLAEVTAALDANAGPLTKIDGGAMSEADRALTYAIATWLSQFDVVGSAGTSQTLQSFVSARVLITLAEGLKVPSALRMRAVEVSYKVACLSDRPEAYDLKGAAERLAPLLFPTA